MAQTRVVRRDEGESDDSVDDEALEKLEALQRKRMAEMFGFDEDDSKPNPEQRKKGGSNAGAKMQGDKAALDVKKKQNNNGPQTHRPFENGEKRQKVANSNHTQPAQPVPKKTNKGQKDLGLDFSKRPSATGMKSAVKSADFDKERASFMSASVSKVYSADIAAGEELRGRKRRQPGQEEADFMSAARSVAELGASGFDKKKKKDWEAQKLRALGAKEPKKQKVPYNILMGQLKKQKERDDKRQKLEAEAGLVLKKPKAKRKGATKISLNTSGVLRVDKNRPSRARILPSQRR